MTITRNIHWSPKAFSLLLAAVLLAGCGSSPYIYLNHVNSSGGDSYFKVPSNWTVFHQDQIFRATSGQVPVQTLRQLESSGWSNIIEGHPNAKLNISLGLGSFFPYGITQQLKLTSSQSSSVTLASLRQILLPSDPLSSAPNSSGLSYQMISYHEFSSRGGFRGSTMLVRIIGSNGEVSVLDQKAMLDSQKKWIYLIGIGCVQSCFSSNESTITEVVNSWNVKGR